MLDRRLFPNPRGLFCVSATTLPPTLVIATDEHRCLVSRLRACSKSIQLNLASSFRTTCAAVTSENPEFLPNEPKFPQF